jgi:hypothetical protein
VKGHCNNHADAEAVVVLVWLATWLAVSTKRLSL